MLIVYGDYYAWQRGDNASLGPYFSTVEYACRCSNIFCKTQRIHKEIIKRNTAIRKSLGAPLHVTSGFRCSAHQAELRAQGLETAVGVSQHELGNASDIQAEDMATLYSLCEAQYSAIGKAKSFVHVDLRAPHADGTKRLWSYSK